jgi:hypothetical protein
MNDHVRATCLTDARYALRQLREFRDIGRAIDALERIECRLEHAEEYDEFEQGLADNGRQSCDPGRG